MASFESPELRVWRPGSEAWLCRWQGRLGWFASSLGASVSSSENSREDLMASQVPAGLNSSGCSIWTDFLPGACRACPAGPVPPPPPASQDQKGLFPAGVCCGWTDTLTSPGIPRGTSVSAVAHRAFKICLCYTRDFSQK